MTREARSLRCPENVLGWIPWYSEGSLNERQEGAVQAHASECAECRSELEMIAGAPFEIDVDLPDPDRLFEEITARIESGELSTDAEIVANAKGGVEDRLADEESRAIERWVFQDPEPAALESTEASVVRGPWSESPGWAAAAAAVLITLGAVLGAIVSGGAFPTEAEATYTLAAAPAAPDAREAVGPLLEVVFLDGAESQVISDQLRMLGIEIVAGPSNLGVYRLRLTEGAVGGDKPTAADAAVIAARLKSSDVPIVLYAEAIAPEAAP